MFYLWIRKIINYTFLSYMNKKYIYSEVRDYLNRKIIYLYIINILQKKKNKKIKKIIYNFFKNKVYYYK